MADIKLYKSKRKRIRRKETRRKDIGLKLMGFNMIPRICIYLVQKNLLYWLSKGQVFAKQVA